MLGNAKPVGCQVIKSMSGGQVFKGIKLGYMEGDIELENAQAALFECDGPIILRPPVKFSFVHTIKLENRHQFKNMVTEFLSDQLGFSMKMDILDLGFEKVLAHEESLSFNSKNMLMHSIDVEVLSLGSFYIPCNQWAFTAQAIADLKSIDSPDDAWNFLVAYGCHFVPRRAVYHFGGLHLVHKIEVYEEVKQEIKRSEYGKTKSKIKGKPDPLISVEGGIGRESNKKKLPKLKTMSYPVQKDNCFLIGIT